MALKTKFVTDGRLPVCAPNPAFPNGQVLDWSAGAKRACSVEFPYPAPSCGLHLIDCDRCGFRAAITAAGRVDDPRSVKIACKHVPGEPVGCGFVPCENTARWQVGIVLFPVTPEGEKPPHGTYGLTTLCLCDEHRACATREEMFTEDARQAIGMMMAAQNITVDWDRAEIELIELVKGDPLPITEAPALGERRFNPQPKGKAN